MRVLVVEDDPAIQHLLASILQARGHGVVAVGDGEAAWDAFAGQGFPMVLLDMGLPGIDGLELCRRFRREPGGQYCQILAITARKGRDELQAILDAGADDYLSKPVDLKLLGVRLAVCERQVDNGELRRAAEAALKASEERYRTLVEHATDAFFMFEPDGPFLEVNQRACEELGYSRGELLQLAPADVVVDFSHRNAELVAEMAGGKPMTVEAEHRRRDGSTFPVEVRLGLLDADGWQRIIALSRDISERRRMAEEREQLNEQLYNLNYLHRLRNGLQEAGAVDEAVLAVCGELLDTLSFVEAAGVQVVLEGERWVRGQLGAPGQALYERPLSWGERERGVFRLAVSGPLSGVQERVLVDESVVQLCRVLEAHELQLQLLQTDRLASLGQMAAGLAHELNQPLNAISTTAESLLLRVQDGVEVGQGDLGGMMEYMMGMVRRMTDTIEHVRLFSRDTQQDALEPFSLNDLVTSSLTLIEAQLRHRSIDLDLDLCEVPPLTLGRFYQMERVLLNLLANARDALDEKEAGPGGAFAKRIAVSTRRDQRRGQVVLEVADNATGMERKTQERIFEPFFTTKETDRGTGLGLAISYAIVQDHAGQLRCASRMGEGTTFTLVLPATGGGAS